MNSKETSLISAHPFIQRFVFSIIQNIREKNFNYEERVVIHADLVPKVSENVMKASMKWRPSKVPEVGNINIKKPEIKKRDMNGLVAPLRNHRSGVGGQVVKVRPVASPARVVKKAAMDVAHQGGGAVSRDSYGKLEPLFGDPSVSTIECLGEDKELMIIRAGQRQRTRISLNRVEIRGILERAADEAHVPLLEGVFRAALPSFSINAVISDVIGSRFVIKKATAYNLLE